MESGEGVSGGKAALDLSLEELLAVVAGKVCRVASTPVPIFGRYRRDLYSGKHRRCGVTVVCSPSCTAAQSGIHRRHSKQCWTGPHATDGRQLERFWPRMIAALGSSLPLRGWRHDRRASHRADRGVGDGGQSGRQMPPMPTLLVLPLDMPLVLGLATVDHSGRMRDRLALTVSGWGSGLDRSKVVAHAGSVIRYATGGPIDLLQLPGSSKPDGR